MVCSGNLPPSGRVPLDTTATVVTLAKSTYANNMIGLLTYLLRLIMFEQNSLFNEYVPGCCSSFIQIKTN